MVCLPVCVKEGQAVNTNMVSPVNRYVLFSLGVHGMVSGKLVWP